MTTNFNAAIVYSAYGSRASYYDDWLDAFLQSPLFTTESFNIAQKVGQKNFSKKVKEFDLIILLHSVNADNLIYVREIKAALQERKGKLFSFVGNELCLPGAPLLPKIEFLKDIEADYIGTQLLLETAEYLYQDTGAKIIATPHALNPDAFSPTAPQNKRPIDIGIRSFRYPSTFLGDEDRNRILDLFAANDFDVPLITDISTTKRLNRYDWAAFLNQCKGTVSNEAGGHWIEKDDKTTIAIKKWLKESGNSGKITIPSESKLRKLSHKLPWGVRKFLIYLLSNNFVRHEALIGNDICFEEIYELFFKDKVFPPKYSGKCVSSRHFDAVGTHTCLIMLEGRFNNIFYADEHYISLKRDFSNVNEVIEKLQDIDFRTSMVNNTYNYVMENHLYEHRIKHIYKKIHQ